MNRKQDLSVLEQRRIAHKPKWDNQEERAVFLLRGSCKMCLHNKTMYSSQSGGEYRGCMQWDRLREVVVKECYGHEEDTFGNKVKAPFHVDGVCRYYKNT